MIHFRLQRSDLPLLKMLRELHISNLAVIADARIELSVGLNCFTGATGAGKSLVIGAIELLLGLRSGSDMLRRGVDEGRVSGSFDIRDKHLLKQLEAATDMSLTSDGGEVLLTRRLYASGRSAVALNGNPITLSMLKSVAEALVDVHGQHDHQYLLKPAHQIDVLDGFGDLWNLRRKYHDVYAELVEARRRLDELSTNRTLRQQQLDLYRFQANEIDAAELDAHEYTELTSRVTLLQNLEKLKKDAGATYSALYEADGSIVERLKMASAVIAELAMLDQGLKPVAMGLRDATIAIEESSYDLSRYIDKLDLDPAELGEVADQLNVINRVLNKYGDPLEATLAYRAEIGAKIEELERAGDDDSSLGTKIGPLTKELNSLAAELTKARRAAAKKLSPLIEKQLAELGMEKAKFAATIAQVQAGPDGFGFNASGVDVVEFIAQTNPGLSPQPLRKIASGGELSRVMLALKGILAKSDRVSVLVFDEIDANVGGRLGAVIGDKLRALADHHQVLCITHLPQIAAYADRHITVQKQSGSDETRTTVRAIDGVDRLQELAEMIGGQRVTDTTRAQARELLETATRPQAPPIPAMPSKPSRGKPVARRAVR